MYPVESDVEFTGEWWPFWMNWRDNMKVNYQFNTIVVAARFLAEQRRPAETDMRVSLEVKYTMTSDNMGEFLNFSRYAKRIPVYIALYNEHLGLRSPIESVPVPLLPIEEDMGLYYQINKAQFVVLRESDLVAIKEVDQIDELLNNVILSHAVVTAFTEAVQVFPLIKVLIDEPKITALTNSVFEIDCKFNEFRG